DYYLMYRTDPSPMVVLARLLGVTADAATVVGVAVIGERLRRGAGLLATAMVAAAPVMILHARTIHADTLMTTLAVWGVERLLAGSGHLGNLERPASLYDLGQIGHDLGWVAVALLAVSLLDLMRPGRDRGERLALWLVLLAFAVPISLGRILAQRYLTPVIP